jgi:hypothetical protein
MEPSFRCAVKADEKEVLGLYREAVKLMLGRRFFSGMRFSDRKTLSEISTEEKCICSVLGQNRHRHCAERTTGQRIPFRELEILRRKNGRHSPVVCPPTFRIRGLAAKAWNMPSGI